jgi:signal transduction histidine kinase
MRPLPVLLFLIWGLARPAFAQMMVPDSLFQEFKTAKARPQALERDSLMVSLLFELIQHMHPIVGIPWNDSLRIYANQLNNQHGLLLHQLCVGDSLNLRANFEKGTKLLLSTTQNLEKGGYWAHAAFGYLRIGATEDYLHQSNSLNVDPLFYYDKALRLAERSELDDILVQVMGYIADYHLQKKEYKRVIENQLKAQQIILSKKASRAFKHYWSVVFTLGTAYLKLGEEAKARRYLEKSLQLLHSPGKKPYLHYTVHINLAAYLFEKSRFQESLSELTLAEQALDEWNTKQKLADADRYRASLYDLYYQTYKSMGDLNKALYYLEKVLAQKELNLKNEVNRQYLELFEKYKAEESAFKIRELENRSLQESNQQRQQLNVFLLVISALLLGMVVLALWTRKIEVEKNKAKVKLLQTKKDAASLLIQTQETERQRIAADLHDDLGGTLATLRRHLDDARRQLHDPRDHQLFDRLEPLIHKSAKDLRRISHNLMPPEFTRLGLAGAIEQLVAAIPPYPTHFELVVGGQPWPLPHETQLNLYRIVSELVHNIIKHAQATRTTVELLYYPDHLTLLVEDNGKGILLDKNMNMNEGIGLKNSRLRAEYLGATIRWEAAAGGTCVVLELPYTQASDHEARIQPGLSL